MARLHSRLIGGDYTAPVVAELNAAVGSHQNSLPLRGRWHRVADTMTEGVVRLARTARFCFAVNDALRPGFHLIRRRVFTLLLHRKYVARRHLPRQRGRQGHFGFQNALAKGKPSLPSPKVGRLRVAGGNPQPVGDCYPSFKAARTAARGAAATAHSLLALLLSCHLAFLLSC